MRKKTIMTAIVSLCLVSIVAGVWMDEGSATPLSLSVRLVSPCEGAIYTPNSVSVKFSYSGAGFFGVVQQPTCYFYIDGNRIELQRIDQGVSLGQEYNMTKTVARSQVLNVTDGEHYLSVGIDVWYNHTLVSVYNPRLGYNEWISREDYFYGHSQVIHFTVIGSTPTSTASSSPTPTPTQEPTPNPSPTLEPSLEPAQTPTPIEVGNQTLDLTPIVFAAAIAVVAVAVGALVYLRKRRLL